MNKYLYRDDQPLAFGGECMSGTIKQQPEDFQVMEQLGYELEGAGDHQWLLLEKANTNTEMLARDLAKFARVRLVDVGYAGLKDRNAVTQQWFSIDLSGKEPPDWSVFEQQYPLIRVIEVVRHRRKLKRGGLCSNRFVIRVLHAEMSMEHEKACIEERVNQIQKCGVPNYFGPQRFGRGGENVIKGLHALSAKKRSLDRHKRSIYLSALRSFLFNQVLARRVSENTWSQYLSGDVLMLDGASSIFVPQPDEPDLQKRLDAFDVHVTGPLWGEGVLRTQDEVEQVEKAIAADYAEVAELLQSVRNLNQERRSLRLRVKDLVAHYEENATTLRFELEKGAYATSVLREIFCFAEQ
ncbi:MAG: tRNA pseudouridine(13) synthase TruD [Gammaproteobacteria bacterium]|nr:tRNA pseudouridine(13) synthase TruD [Gammaproteobacteria bacterium]